MDRLLSTAQCGERLGGKHPKDVIILIRKGRLKAKRMNVRGRSKTPKDHYMVFESELDRYMRELPDATPNPALSERPPGRPAKRQPRRGTLKGVIAFA